MSIAAAAREISLLDAPSEYMGKTIDGQPAVGEKAQILANKVESIAVSRTLLSEPSPEMETEASLGTYSKLEAELRRLLKLPGQDEFGPRRPSESSVFKVRSLFFSFARTRARFPSPTDIDTDHDGSIRISWENGDRFLELITPQTDNDPSYIYFSVGEEYGIARDVSPKSLLERLDWLSNVATNMGD